MQCFFLQFCEEGENGEADRESICKGWESAVSQWSSECTWRRPEQNPRYL